MAKVTDKYLLKLKPKATRYTVPAGESLFLRVHPSGVKSWVLRAYLLPFGRGGHPINKQHLSKWLLHTPLKGKLCHHGLRATGRTWMRDQGVAHEVAEDAIAHVTMTQTERAYIRGDFLEQRRPVMQHWWDFIYTSYCAYCAPLPGIEPPKNAE